MAFRATVRPARGAVQTTGIFLIVLGVAAFAGLLVFLQDMSETGATAGRSAYLTLAIPVLMVVMGIVTLLRGRKGHGVDVEGELGPGRAEERLRALDDLKAKGLVTAKEYDARRAAILAEV